MNGVSRIARSQLAIAVSVDFVSSCLKTFLL